jgi:photosystem II stability/assembly factor-like uncharacterized protein
MKNQRKHARQLCGLALALVGLMIGIAVHLASTTVAASTRQPGSGLVSSAHGQENPLSLNGWSSNGPDGGPVLALAIDRSNPATVYAGTPTGVFKSTDGGGSWSSSLTDTDVQIVAIAPTTPTTLLAAGSRGIHKSTDGGASWNAVNNGLENQHGPIHILALAIDPTNSNIVYAAGPDITDPSVTYKAIYKSTDGGGSWSITKNSILPYAVHHTLTIDPVSPNVIYAAGSVGGGAVWKSTDNGRGWILVNVGLDNRSTVYTLAIPTNTNVIYVGTESLGVYKSSDGGASWSTFNDGLPYYNIEDNGQRDFWRVSSILIDPGNPSVIYAGTYNGVYKSSNGGSWIALNGGLTNLGVNALAIDAGNRSIIYAGTDGGIFKSNSAGASWSAANQGVRGINVSSVATNPGNANVYAGGDSATFSSSDNGGSWAPNDFYPLAIDPRNPNTIYATRVTGRDGLSRSSDGGATWSSANTGLENSYVYVLAIDPGNSQIIYAGTDGSLFKTTNGGGSWSAIGDLSFLTSLAIDPKNSQTLYAVAPDCYSSPVYKSTDGGVTWKTFDAGTFFYAYSSVLAIDPINTDTIYVSAYAFQAEADRLFKSTDGGGSWNAIETGPVNSPSSLAIDPVHPNNLYAGTTSDGVFKSVDGGATWNPFNDGLTNLNINALGIDGSGTFLHAGTQAGVFDYQLRLICAFSTSLASQSFPSGGAMGSVSVTATSGCTWQASSIVSWITINSGSGSGDGTVSFSVGANAEPFPRRATLSVAGQSFTVNQFGAQPINPADDTQFFVRQQYLDFLNRQPDATGLDFWGNNITSCGFDSRCFEVKRIDTSAAFFLSIEFQQTGYLVYRFYKASYGNLPGAPVPIRLNEFLPDTKEIGQGVIVNQNGWEQLLENNKQAFTTEFVQRSRFNAAYPTSMTPAAFVDTLFANAGVTPAGTDRTAAINEFGSANTTADVAARVRALRRVAENATLAQQEFNRAFVLMQYFGYLRRNPNDSPEPTLDFQGYNFWLTKLNQFGGNFQNAEMVKAFLVSSEYRQRFGP